MEEEELAKFCDLSNPFDPIDFMIFKEEIKDDFQNIYTSIFENNEDKKALVISKSLFPRFFYIFSYQEIVKKGFKIYYFELCPQAIEEFNVLFIIPPEQQCIDIIAKQMDKDESAMHELKKDFQKNKDRFISKKYFYLYVPKIDISLINYTEENYGERFESFQKYFDFELLNIPFDYDLISLEDKLSFKELFLFKFSDCVDNLANLLIKIEDIFGKIKYRYILGENSKIVSDFLDKKEKEGFLSDKNNDEILACFFIDRSVDYITPFCTELTYEALLHQFFNINFLKIKVKNEIAKIKREKKKEEKKEDEKDEIKEEEKKEPEKTEEEKLKEEREQEEKERQEIMNIMLGFNDKLFQIIKDFNFGKLGLYLTKRYEYQDLMFKKMKNTRSKELDSDKVKKEFDLVREMNTERPQLKMHINLFNYIRGFTSLPQAKRRLNLEQTLLQGGKDCLDLIHDYYDSEMVRKSDPYDLLKLFCLENLAFGGVKGKIYDSFKNDFLMTYDDNYFFLIKNLEELKILNKDGKSKLYQMLLEKLGLINFNVNTNQPNDTSYVFGGFSPITIRFIEKALKVGWSNFQKDLLFKNLGIEYDFPQDENPIMNPKKDTNYILLVFTGGITYSEIGAVRYLNTSPEYSKYKFLIITTNIINAKDFFDEIKDDKIESRLDESAIPKPEENAVPIMDKKTLEKHKKKEKEEQKKKDKEERERMKKKLKQERELEKDRAEYRKMKEKLNKK